VTTVCEDWRGLGAEEAAALVVAEALIWRHRLDWDVMPAWNVIEPARAAGRLPGFVARDPSGRVTGWTCFLVHGDALQVAMLVAETRDVTLALVDGIVSSTEAASATRFALSVRDAAPGLRDALIAQGFGVATYRYLTKEGLRDSKSQRFPESQIQRCRDVRIRGWDSDDLEPMARLAARAYARSKDVRAFAVDGTPDEWTDYVTGLVTRPGCGRFLPEASFSIDREAGELEAAILITEVGPGTSHIAQIAVDPGVRRRGLGRTLIQAAIAQSFVLGYTRMTLFVANANAPAVRLYEHCGFRDQAAFVVSAIGQPRRSTSAALATVGDNRPR
jgi:ribosomal protein S18 acetylase RimI-like enzyme